MQWVGGNGENQHLTKVDSACDCVKSNIWLSFKHQTAWYPILRNSENCNKIRHQWWLQHNILAAPVLNQAPFSFTSFLTTSLTHFSKKWPWVISWRNYVGLSFLWWRDRVCVHQVCTDVQVGMPLNAVGRSDNVPGQIFDMVPGG